LRCRVVAVTPHPHSPPRLSETLDRRCPRLHRHHARRGRARAQRGLVPLEALLTETEPFRELGLAALAGLEIGGCDLAPGTLAQSAHVALAGVGTFPVAMIDALIARLERITITRGILRGGGATIDALAGDERAATRREVRGRRSTGSSPTSARSRRASRPSS
jgi:hypothetical protein